MAKPKFKLGDQLFISLTRPPLGVMTQLDVHARTGVDGIEVWKTGDRGTPFQVLSVVDCADIATATALLRTYEQMVGKDPVVLCWADQAFDGKVQVLSVEALENHPKRVLGGGGGLVANSTALLRCVWTLIAV